MGPETRARFSVGSLGGAEPSETAPATGARVGSGALSCRVSFVGLGAPSSVADAGLGGGAPDSS